MDNQITKEDLRLFSQTIIAELKELFSQESNETSFEWIRTKVARQLLSISAASLQTLRISGKLRYRKILGSYYYNRADIDNLFKE
ncbi:helix-turn-helix domain-containing protein [Myroides odoratimimus]|uniref:helix-turn-helix domain-containing protein n=1 Tax=Myroides odoratimimus TaxID=76832 RepID=UPI002577FB96|nr:helix-turn-helix domain-containing protein [Myroides odoratimimus]MDM1401275.1 helix-turn-helix domain-containing protein [Myroides odoratimimus]MEC4035754.1 helix-turn-helix domain-containing protein [Myroides odoratimimus]MEC4094726.1 helix-turn-helix domain-containing protein [Myroides odoratimimus]